MDSGQAGMTLYMYQSNLHARTKLFDFIEKFWVSILKNVRISDKKRVFLMFLAHLEKFPTPLWLPFI